MRDRSGMTRGHAAVEREDRARAIAVARLAGERLETQEAIGRSGVAARNRVVVQILATHDELLVIVGRGEEPAAFGIREAGNHAIGRLPGSREPAFLEARLIEGEQRLDEERVI